MDIEHIRKLVELMVANDLSELDVSDGKQKVLLKRGAGGSAIVTQPAVAAQAGTLAAAPAQASQAAPAEQLAEIRSPMVGTFYAASSPDAEPYVAEGAKVGPDSVVCIIEAMKVMNEIKAECSGEIVEVCVRNAQPVEYGQVLFRVRAL